MVSFVDMPKTWLSLTGCPIPESMQGTIFLGPNAEPEEPFHFAYRGRMSERLDNARAVYDKQYVYIRNYMPYVPWVQHLDYLWKMKATQVWEEAVESGQATEVQARFFVPKEYAEELYDLERDPDNVHNLINQPEQEQRVQQMRQALGQWQRAIFDTALIPESEMMKRAQEKGVTIYELARNPDWYPLDELIDAANLALERNPKNIPELHRLLQVDDSGLRYWGMVGIFILEDDSAINIGLVNESDEVRALAAWLAITSLREEEGVQTLKTLLDEQSYATLTVLNMIDWIGGEPASKLLPTVRALEMKDSEQRMKENLLLSN